MPPSSWAWIREIALTLVDRRNFHLFQPMLYQVATGALSPGDIAQPLRSILRRQRNTTVILGEAVGLDPERREVLLSDGGPIAYDTLIVATGAHHTYFGHDDWARLAPGPQDPRGRDRDPPPHPHRVRGRGTGSRSGPAARVDDVRARRWRPDGRGAGRVARRDRARHAPARLPGDRPARGPDHPGRGAWIACCRPYPARSVGLGQAPAGAARRGGPARDARRSRSTTDR